MAIRSPRRHLPFQHRSVSWVAHSERSEGRGKLTLGVALTRQRFRDENLRVARVKQLPGGCLSPPMVMNFGRKSSVEFALNTFRLGRATVVAWPCDPCHSPGLNPVNPDLAFRHAA
jgi:hypothetical protein